MNYKKPFPSPALTALLVLAAVAISLSISTEMASSAATKDADPRTFAEHTVTGRVADKISDVPYSGFIVKVVGADTPHTVFGTASTDEQGHYEISFNATELGPEKTPEISVDLFNRSEQPVKSAMHLRPNLRGATQVDFFLYRGEAFPNDFCCFSSNSFGQCPSAFSLTRQRQLLKQLGRTSRKSWKRRRAVLEQLMSPREPVEDCGEMQKTGQIERMKSMGKFSLANELTASCLSEFPAKTFKTNRFEIKYVEDQQYSPIAVDQARPSVDEELKLNGTSLGWLRANLDVPAYVQQIGLIAEYALGRFLEPPLLLKDPRGDPPRDSIPISICYLGEFAGATSPSQRDIEINSQNSLVQNFATVPHELFHRVQYQYNPTETVSGIYGVMREGGARLIEDSICDSFNRYVVQSQQIFNDPAQSLIHFDSRCDNPISYAAALFWKYLAEQHSLNVLPDNEPDIGIDVYKKILLSMADPNGRPYELISLRDALTATAKPGSFDQFRYLDAAQTELSSNETSWGNYLLANYLHSFKDHDSRFKYLEDQDLITWPFAGDDVNPITNLAQVRAHADEIVVDQNIAISKTVVGLPAYAAHYYRITRGALKPQMLRITLSAFGGINDPLTQIVSLDSQRAVIDISKSDRTSYSKTINLSGVASLIVIVASRMTAGDYTVTFDAVPAGPDVMITRWNSVLLTEYEVNSSVQAWNDTSPDVMIDTNDDLVPDASIVPGADNKLKIRIHNRGNLGVFGVSINLDYQASAQRLAPALWLPVRNASNVQQPINDVALTAAGNPGDSQWAVVDWAPPDNPTISEWCVKVTVNPPGDLNHDNNAALSCFSRSNLKSISAIRP
jgi:hypothetical protein